MSGFQPKNVAKIVTVVGPSSHVDWTYGMNLCTLGTNKQLVARRERVGPEVGVVRIGNLPLTLTSFLLHHWTQKVLYRQPVKEGGLRGQNSVGYR